MNTTGPQTTTNPADRKTFTFEEILPFPPREIFPLLCPTREHDWIEAWTCDLRFSLSGLAELDAVFVTELPDRTVWTVSHHEPPVAGRGGRIEFVLFEASSLVVRLAVTVEPEGEGGSRIAWTRVYTALDEAGRGKLEAIDAAGFEAQHRELDRLLVHYLREGTMWRPGSEVA